MRRNSEKESFEMNIIIASSIIVLIAIISFVSYVAIGTLKTTNVDVPSKTENNEGQVNALNNCLNQDILDYECSLIFWRYSSIENCEEMKTSELRDECFYRAASVNMLSEFCEEIIDDGLRSNCEIGTYLSHDSMEEDYEN